MKSICKWLAIGWYARCFQLISAYNRLLKVTQHPGSVEHWIFIPKIGDAVSIAHPWQRGNQGKFLDTSPPQKRLKPLCRFIHCDNWISDNENKPDASSLDRRLEPQCRVSLSRCSKSLIECSTRHTLKLEVEILNLQLCFLRPFSFSYLSRPS